MLIPLLAAAGLYVLFVAAETLGRGLCGWPERPGLSELLMRLTIVGFAVRSGLGQLSEAGAGGITGHCLRKCRPAPTWRTACLF